MTPVPPIALERVDGAPRSHIDARRVTVGEATLGRLRGVCADVTTDVAEELHCTALVTSSTVPSLSLPCAVSCSVNPALNDELPGETTIDCKVPLTLFTVRSVCPLTEPREALIVDEPSAAPAVASPVVLMLATAGLDELQTA